MRHAGDMQAASAPGGVHTVRRVITYLLLGVMVTITAIGLSGLLERMLAGASTNEYHYYDLQGLAQALAFALIAGPLAAVLWWLSWRGRAIARDRASLAWPVYLVIMSTVALITSTFSLLGSLAELATGRLEAGGLATGAVWGLVWLWHYWMWRHPLKRPTRMIGVAPAIASFFGLCIGAGGLAFLIAALIDSLSPLLATPGTPTWHSIVRPLVWAAGGALLWCWHWFRVGVRSSDTGFARLLLVCITGFASFAAFAVGVAMTLRVVLLLLAGTDDTLSVILDSLGPAVGSAVIGALVFVYHSRIVAKQPVEIRAATRLVTAGVSLAVAASGLGVSVNALLATVSAPAVEYAAEHAARDLLLGGISALIVGGVLWWVTWRPGAGPATATGTGTGTGTGRRAYLIVIFGVSALVALITLLVVGFQLFSYLLEAREGVSFLEESRQALGLLTATVLVAVYHFVIWRRDRSADSAHEQPRTIERVTLVLAGDGTDLVRDIRSATRARVTVLRRTDAVETSQVTPATVLAALDGMSSDHVLVVVRAETDIEVIPLAD